MKVAAIIPSYNEEETIQKVLTPLFNCDKIDQVIVVDDNSKDKTREIARKSGAKVIKREKKAGKGSAMRDGTSYTNAEVILFVDADLLNFTPNNASDLITPVINNEASMAVGVRERAGGLPYFLIKIDPLLAISGMRAMKRSVLENIPPKFIKGFGIETVLNYYCKVNNISVKYVSLGDLKQKVKEEKWGILGFFGRLRMMAQIFKVRIILLFSRDDFKSNPPPHYD